ncbi:hypothetical protein Tco_0751637 [Tanacetum coccineum]|uniref:DUF4378 domain-containing protein n=1 Tax=Tanacetum coccineum TaxID=301880 RepID=A0ABQ4Z792_9ASTR
MLRRNQSSMLRRNADSDDSTFHNNNGYEHQYHIDQMQNFLKNDIVWEIRKEILVLPFPQNPTQFVQSCQRDPKAPALSLVNQDLLYPKKGNSGLEKFMLSLHKFPVVIFSDDDIEKRTSRWIVQVIKTYGELGHEHKFVTYIIVRRANGSIVSITEPDYKNLNKNDIENMYLLCINDKVGDYAEIGLLWSLSVFIRSTVIWERVHDFQLGVESYQQKINHTALTITFPGIEKHKMFSIVSEPVYDIIYKNNKKEKRAMRHQEIHKFCDATLKRVLEGLKSYNNDVNHGYVTPSLSKEDVEYLRLFKEVIKERLKHRDQMRHWEMYYSIAILLFEIAEVVVISSSDEDLLINEEIMLMGGVSFLDNDDDDSAEEQPQTVSTSTSRRHRKISMTGCVLFLRALNASVDKYVKKSYKK